ncbi:MAG: HEPN domain-containing protein [Candidatus Hodarchaeales archaeon]|jgi:HEPN domain-containing protein
MRKPSRDEAERWLLHAQDEFADADELRKRDRFYIALFHFQQAAEKALKAFLYFHLKSIEIFYTHSIADLIELAIEVDPIFEEIKDAKKLDRYYIPTRYPNGLPGSVPSRFFDDPKEAKEAMLLAKQTIELAEQKLSANL